MAKISNVSCKSHHPLRSLVLNGNIYDNNNNNSNNNNSSNNNISNNNKNKCTSYLTFEEGELFW